MNLMLRFHDRNTKTVGEKRRVSFHDSHGIVDNTNLILVVRTIDVCKTKHG